MFFNLKIILDFKESYQRRIGYVDSFMKAMDFTLLGEGRHRRTFIDKSGRFVIKIPHSEFGLAANRNEHRIYREFFNRKDYRGVKYNPCRLIGNSILLMWAVKSTSGYTQGDITAIKTGLVKEDKNLADWAGRVDSSQVGRLQDGRIVAYDYG